MKFLNREKQHPGYSVVIGCGRLGSYLSCELSDNDEDVVVIDKEADAFQKMLPSFAGLTIVGDALDLNVLEEAHIESASQVIVVTDDDNLNITIAQMVWHLFGVHKVITRLYDPEKGKALIGMKIEVIYPSVLSVNEIKEVMEHGKE